MTMPRVYDHTGREQNWAWLETNYGPMEHHLAEHLSEGEEYWALLRIQEQHGNASVKVRCLNLDGSPSSGQHMAFHWPDAPKQPHGCESQWENNFIHQKTDNDGFAGVGLGTGSYYFYTDAPPKNIGVHKVFICGGTKSDLINGVGMLSGTDHHGMTDMVFGLVRYTPQMTEHPPIDHDHTHPGANISLEHRLHVLENWARSYGG